MIDYPPRIKSKRNSTSKPYKGAAHTAKSKKGMGDYYGTGIVAKLGKMRGGMGQEVLSSAKLKKSPRSLV